MITEGMVCEKRILTYAENAYGMLYMHICELKGLYSYAKNTYRPILKRIRYAINAYL